MNRIRLSSDIEDISTHMFSTFRVTFKKLLTDEYIQHFGEQPSNMNTKTLMKSLRNHMYFDGIIKTADFDVRSVSPTEIATMLAHIVFSIYSILCMEYRQVKRVSSHRRRHNVRDFLYEFSGVIDEAPKTYHAVDRMTRALDYIDAAKHFFPICSIATQNVEGIDAYFEYMYNIRKIEDLGDDIE